MAHHSTFSNLVVPKQSEFYNTFLHHVSLSPHIFDDEDLSLSHFFCLDNMITLVSIVNFSLFILSPTLRLGGLTRVNSRNFHRSWSLVRKKQRESLVCSP